MDHGGPQTLRGISDARFISETDRGKLYIIPKCPPDLFRNLELDDGLGKFSHYSSIIKKLEVFEEVAGSRDGRVAIAMVGEKTLAAYGACWYPPKGDRWSKLGDLMYEMGALEVSRNFRDMRLGTSIFAALMEDDFFEDKIAYMNGFSWHWDLDGSGLTMSEYRTMMVKLVRAHGFQECYTNEPNVALREENFFLVRIGSRVSEEDRRRFRNLRFGIADRA